MHTKANRYREEEKIQDVQKANQTKVLGFMFNKNTNCSDHLYKIKTKLDKVQRMLFMAKKNELGKW